MKKRMTNAIAGLVLALAAVLGATSASAGTYCVGGFNRGDVIKAGTKLWADTKKVLFVTIKPKWTVDIFNGDSQPEIYVKGGRDGQTYTLQHDYRVGTLSAKIMCYVQLLRIFKITHNPNGGSGWATSECYYAQPFNAFLSDFRPTKDGKNFWGWAWDNPNASRPDTYPGWWFYQSQDRTLYAVWRYNCAFQAPVGGTVSNAGRNNVWERETTSSTATAGPGYVFSHWSGPTGKSYNPTITVARNGTWTANFKGIPYFVEYDGNGAESGSMESTAHTYGTPTKVRKNTFVKKGYFFSGWSRDPKATYADVEVDDEGNVTDLTTTPNSSVKLYAVWQLPVDGWINASTWAQIKQGLQTPYNVKMTANATQNSDTCYLSWQQVILDLNGKTLYSQCCNWLIAPCGNNASITVRDSASGGRIAPAASGHGVRCMNVSSGDFILESGTMTGFDAGFAQVGGGGRFTMNGGSITSCSAYDGGAVINDGSFKMYGGTISSCSASHCGGAVYNNSNTFEFWGGDINWCYASGDGGGIFAAKGTVSVYGGGMQYNHCAGWGGAFGANVNVYIYGGYYYSNWSDQGMNFFDGAGYNKFGLLYGGVWYAYNPMAVDTCGECNCQLMNGAAVSQIGSYYVIGRNLALDKNSKISGGTYSFPPYGRANSYRWTGLFATGLTQTKVSETEWKFGAKEPVLCSAWSQVKANLEAGNDVKLTQSISQGSVVQLELNGSQDVVLDLNGYTITKFPSYWTLRLMSADAHLTVTDTSTAKTGAIVGNGTGHSADGAMIRIEAGKMTVNGCTFNNTYTSSNGGLAYVGSGATLELNGTKIANCKCGKEGGAIVNYGTFTASDTTFTGCTATADGGAIYNAGNLEINGGTITACSSGNGGALKNEGAAATSVLERVTFSGNAVTYYGGAINCGDKGGSVTLRDCTFAGNKATSCGGGAIIVGASSILEVYDCVFTNNTAVKNAGAIYQNGHTTTNNRTRVYGGIFRDNTVGSTAVDFANDQPNGFTVYGGVYAITPVSSAGSNTTVLAEGAAVETVNGKFVVGKGVLLSEDKIVAGTFTFDPKGAIYADQGLLDANAVESIVCATTPATWKIRPTDFVAVDNAELLSKLIEAGCDVRLTKDITAEGTLDFSSSSSARIDLKGHTLTAAENLPLFAISGVGADLTIIDTVGGGACAGSGTVAAGAAFASIAEGANLTFAATNAAVRGFAAADGAGAVALADGASFEMVAGAITNCVGTTAGAVYVPSNGVFTAGGLAYIRGNVAPAAITNNVCLAAGAVVTVSTNTPFAAGARIGLTLSEKPSGEGCIAVTAKPDETAGYVANLDYFESDIYGYTLQDGDENRLWMYVRAIEIEVYDCENLSNVVVTVDGEVLEKTNGVYQVLIGTTNIVATYTAVRGYAWVVGGEYVTTLTFGPKTALFDPLVFGETLESPGALVAAKIGETEYAFLEDALAAAKPGERIVLCSDAVLDETFVIEKDVLIDLCGNDITGPDNGAGVVFRVRKGGELRIVDDHDGAEGEVRGIIEREGTGTVQLSGGKFTPVPDETFVSPTSTMDGEGRVTPKEGKVTFRAKDKDGNEVGDITVDWAVLAKNGLEKPEDLNRIGENGIPMWQALSLGLDPKDATAVPLASPVQQADGEKVVVDIENVSATPEVSGTTVHYRLMASDDKETWQEVGEPAATPTGLQLQKKDDGSYWRFYKTKAVIVTE